jgi:RecB family exonuclease
VVDDAQDLTAAGAGLVVALARSGAPVLLTTCPDESVDTFRGALPEAAELVTADLGRRITRIDLGDGRGPGGTVGAALGALRARLPLAGADAGSRRPPAAGAPGDGPDAASGPALAVVTAADAAHEAQVIAATLRDLHHGDQVDFADMAVVCRSGAVVEEMADMLQRAGVRTSTPRRPRPLREEHVVADLLRILELGASCARGEEPRIDGPEAMALLRGPFGDADTLRLRRIRRELRDGSVAAEDGAESADGADLEDGADSAVLLAHALVADPDIAVPGLRGAEERDRATVPVHRIRRMIHAVAALGTDADALEALWVAWEAAHVADGWQKAVLGEDPLGEKAGERNGERAEADDARAHMLSDRLDAITSVFAAAERLNERQGRIDVLVFVDHVRSRAVAEDTLAPLAEPTGRIAVITPTQLAGSTREVVVLARVQEGGWPNMRLRSTLFGAAELSAVARAQHTGGEVPLSPVALRALGRDQVLADELRLAVSALSRARSRVLVTAIDGGEQVPSVLVDLLREQVRDPWLDVERLQADPGPAPDVRRLVAALRRRILDGPVLDEPEAVRDPTGPRHAAGLLGALREAGAPGTDPGTWYHQDPSGREPLAAPDAPVTLSPSALERANDCPQAFVLERAGATRPPGPAQSVGTAVHRFAQENPAGVPEDEVASAIARVEELLAPLDLQGTWSGRQILERARRSVTVLLEHLRSAPPALGVEVPFVVDLPGVRLRGIMDRIEGEPGALRVVDVKTGRRAKSQGEAEQDLQLGAYQTAIDQDALADLLGEDAGQALNGAHLVYVGTGTSTARIRTQPPPARSEDPAWFTTIATRVAGDLRGESLRAVKNAHCDVCTVRRSCALWPQGATL